MQDAQITVLTAFPPGQGDAVMQALAATFEVVGSVTSLDAAVASAIDLIPDVLIIHDDLGRERLAEAARTVIENVPVSRLLIVTDGDDASTYDIVRNGGFAFIPTDSKPETYVEATRGAARHESLVTPNIAEALLAEMSAIAEDATYAILRPPTLTLTEQEVLKLMARGDSAAEIAEIHDVTARLVNMHVGYAVAKLQQHLSERRQLIRH